MVVKVFGVLLVIFSCGGVGFKIASNYKKEERFLYDFILILEYMTSELKYRFTSLPQLCRQASNIFHNSLSDIFRTVADELELKQYSEPAMCITYALSKYHFIPPITRNQLISLSNCIGRFDIDGQVKSIESVKSECERNLLMLRNNKENRIRSYQTLGLCAGAALAIIFI